MRPQGTFVQIEGGTDGIGKLVDTDVSQADIEYFESPAGPRLHHIKAPLASVREVELPPQTRIFWFDSGCLAWRAGRVDGGLISAQALRANEDHYHVRFPNDQEARLPVSQLYVRWSRPIEDPTDYLAARITDTPFFFDGRSQIVRHIAEQRAAFGGLTALASAAVELIEHQVTIVRRILADPVERYLLADEVGLGKTIEAGILIRQHIIDHPNQALVLVLVPDHLVSQWKRELATKFFLSSGSPVKVVPESALARVQGGSTNATLLVVDEAHRVALRAFSEDPAERRYYEQLRALTIAVPRLLLLSGTPVLHQEEGFLAMLHLLEPDAYALSDRESFRDRVRERQTVAEATIDLMDDTSSLFVQDAVDRIQNAFGADARLVQLCSEVREQTDKDVQDPIRIAALQALRTHLSEVYRLHRRLLRTRRDDPRVQLYVPQRSGVIAIEYDDDSRIETFDFLDTWRLAAADRDSADVGADRIFASFVAAALSHPTVLLRQIDTRLGLHRREVVSCADAEQRTLLGLPWIFDGEKELLEHRRQLIAKSTSQERRAVGLADWLESNRDLRKIIVFTDDSVVADTVATTLQGQLGSAVVRYNGDLERLREFEGSATKRVLVCDASAEEGLNLQRCGAAIVHYDLPLEPTRIEQRIGRIDRIEARGQLRNIIFASTNPYEYEWQVCLIQAIRVFNRSVAPLQYALAEATKRIRSRLAREGRTAFNDETARLSDAKNGLNAELRRIQAQEAIDSIEINSDQDAAFVSRLIERDDLLATDGENSLSGWVEKRLHFVHQALKPNVVRYLHDVGRPTLLPTFETLTRFRDCIDESGTLAHSRFQIPLKPITFDRATAERTHVPLLRIGHPFMQALEAQVRSDDRGTAFAVWRYIPRLVQTPRFYFRFDFLIESSLAEAQQISDPSITSIQALRRRADDAFPVEYRTVWLNSDLKQVTNSKLLAVLGLPYTRQSRPDGGRDVNLRPDRWERIAEFIQVGDWHELCWRARNVAEQLVRNDPNFVDHCKSCAAQAYKLALATSNAAVSRIARLSGPLREIEERGASLERSIGSALIQGIERPIIRVDSAGVLVLASTLAGAE